MIVAGLSAATRVYVATEPVDLRGGFNRLCALVKNRLHADPLSGQLYVFSNRTRNRMKVLYWDGSGFWVCAKRLEQGCFAWPQSSELSSALRGEQWNNLVQGLEVVSRRNWYRR
jgi:transposase